MGYSARLTMHSFFVHTLFMKTQLPHGVCLFSLLSLLLYPSMMMHLTVSVPFPSSILSAVMRFHQSLLDFGKVIMPANWDLDASVSIMVTALQNHCKGTQLKGHLLSLVVLHDWQAGMMAYFSRPDCLFRIKAWQPEVDPVLSSLGGPLILCASCLSSAISVAPCF